MSYDEIESLWGSQQPPAGSRPALADLKQRLAPELRRRSRFFGYELFCLGFALVVTPLIAVGNYRHSPPAYPAIYWLHFTLYIAVVLAFLVAAVRRLRRHRALIRAGTETLAAFAAKSLATVENEMHDCRLGLQALPIWFGLVLLSIFVNQPPAVVGWTPLLSRMAFVLAFALVGGAVCWWQHRKLQSEHVRRQQVLAELS